MFRNPLSSSAPTGRSFSRRRFLRLGLGTTALSLSSAEALNAAILDSVARLGHAFPDQESPDGAYWQALRKHYLFEDDLIMMNNGTVGPMPKPVFNTLMKVFRVQVSNPYDVYNYLPAKKEEVRRKLADFIGASAEEVVLSSNTTEGLNFVASGLDLKEGDEVLVSNFEHPGASNPWSLRAKRSGVKIKEVRVGLPHKSTQEIVDAFAAAITPQTKIISTGHTVYVTGLIMPVREISKMAHEKGILVLADSAHGLGMLDLNMHDLGVDFFASSPYKWMGAPCGIGLFYVRKESQSRLWPTIVSSGWDTYTDARKYETHGQGADALVYALGEALEFQTRIGKSRIEKRIKTMAAYFRQELRKIPGIRVNTPDDPYLSGGLTAFSLEGVDCARIVDYVRDKYNLVVRTIGSKDEGTYAIRVSTPIYVSTKEVDMLLEGVRTLSLHRS